MECPLSHSAIQSILSYSQLPLALLVSNPCVRLLAEGSGKEIILLSNRYTWIQTRNSSQLTCVIADAYGVLFTRWWLRRSRPTGLTIKYGKISSPNYTLSLGEIMSLGNVDRLELTDITLPGTAQELFPFLTQSNKLEVLRARQGIVPLNELLAVMSSSALTLSIVEVSHIVLPTLQIFGLCPNLCELELRNTVIGSMNLVVGSDQVPGEANGVDKPFSDLATLRFLQKLDLSKARDVLNLSGLQKCTSLRSLNLSSSNVTSENVEQIGKMPFLTDLILSRTRVSDVTPLVGCTSLSKLQLSNSYVTTSGIAGLETLPCLRHLDLSYTRVSGVSFLGDSSCLTVLNLWKTRITSDDLVGLFRMSLLEHLLLGDNTVESTAFFSGALHLKKVVLQSTLITTQELAAIGHLSSLEDINLSHTVVNSISALSHCRSMRRIDAQNTFVDGNGLDQLNRLPQLEVLLLSHTSVDHLDGLAGSPSLRELHLKWCDKLSPDALEGLRNLETLESLYVTHCGVENAWPLSGCSGLRELNMWTTMVTSDGLGGLEALGELSEVDVAETLVSTITPFLRCKAITSLTLYSLPVEAIEGLETLPLLKRLDLANTKITTISCLSSCPALEVLNISDTAVDDAGFQGIGRVATLRVIMLSSTQVTNISELGACYRLEELFAKSTPITSDGITFLECATSLLKVNLSFTQIESGILRFAHCRRLTKLNLKCTNVSVEEVEALRRYLPTCNISDNALQRDKKGVRF